MKLKLALIVLLIIIGKSTYSQELDTGKLDELFNSLEIRNEAMGSITISRNGKKLYNRAIGYRYIDNNIKILADTATNYRIWSITKTYTATMILQLVEEGKLSMQTTLDRFYPEIPNSTIITIQEMLSHKSGIHDFAQNDPSDDLNSNSNKPLTHEFMVKNISKYKSDFKPGEGYRYSNSNYLILGYIIELLDNNLYEESLSKRISSKIELTSTYFGTNELDSIKNKAYSYQFNKQWVNVDEGDFSGLIPAGAGGIVSTTSDMAKFIEALFSGKLISKNSLKKMIDIEDSYGLGMMKIPFEDTNSFGHTGGYIASESSLFYYPKDSLAIAYCTNGIVIRKEEILNHVLEIYHNKPFAVSLNRKYLAMIILCIGLLMFIGYRYKVKSYFKINKIHLLGYAIAILFWTGIIISGFMRHKYSHTREGVTNLDSFYSNSGTFMASIQLIMSLFSIPFLIALYKKCKTIEVSFLPILPILFLTFSLAGSSLFPSPNKLYFIFINMILLTAFGPFLVVLLWRKKQLRRIRLLSVVSLFLMGISIGLIISRPIFPIFINEYFGLIQRLLYLGCTLWIVSLSLYFLQIQNKERSKCKTKVEKIR